MKYFWLTIKHKWFVFLAGIRTGAPLWRLVIHDWSKFLPSELPHYQRQFFGAKDDPEGFIGAWIHHQNHNPHHWEYWIPRTGHNRCTPPYPDGEPVMMPKWAAREMVADWLGASRAYEGRWPTPGNWPWLEKNWGKIRVHKRTRDFLDGLLLQLGFHVPEVEDAEQLQGEFIASDEDIATIKEAMAAGRPVEITSVDASGGTSANGSTDATEGKEKAKE